MLPVAGSAQTADRDASAPPADLQLLHLEVNRHRASVGCTKLEWHGAAARVAEGHSRDMAARDYFDHVSPEGTDPGRRLLSAGVSWSAVAENIALTPAGPESALELWLDSPPHRENIERCEFTHHGVGAHGDRWTQILVQQPRP